MVEQPRNEQDREKGTEVHRKIKPAERPREEVLVVGAELVADVGRDAGLDAARADRDQREAERQAEPGVIESQREAAEAVD